MTELEKIEYKPIPVREALTKMKDLSELMIDLAYSAALFNSHELADEVLELEEEVDTLAYLLDMNAMIAARDAEDAEDLVGIFVVAAATNKISDAAADIAILVRREIGIHPIVREAFKEMEEQITRVEVKPTSTLIEKSLGELELAARIGVDIIAIHRKKEWIINPSEDQKIVEGDVLIARGAPLGVEKLMSYANGTIKEFEKLEREGKTTMPTKEPFKNIVRKLVSLKDTSELMIDLAYSSLLLNSQELAKEVQMLEEHMDNLHTEFELLVLSSGFTPEESKDFLGLIRLGVVTEKIADAAAAIAQVVLRGLEPHPVLRLVIEEAEETVTRVRVSEKSPLVGKTLKYAQIPEETGMWVLAIRRWKRCLRPRLDTVIRAGDILIASGYAEGEEDLKRLASGIPKRS